MKKIIFTVVCIVAIALSFMNVSAEQIYYNDEFHYYDAGVIGLEVNGSAVSNLPMYPVIINDYTMVPVREVFEAMGSQVIWHDATCQVEIVKNGVSVLVKIGDRNIIVNGQVVPISSEQPLPMLIGKDASGLKSMVPVRFVAEKLGYNVSWDDVRRTVLISEKNENPDEIMGEIEPEDTITVPQNEGLLGKIVARKDNVYDYIHVPAKKGVSPKITRYSSPERVVFDFPGVSFEAAGGNTTLEGNCVSSVRYSNHETSARVVLDVYSKDTQVMVLSDKDGILIRAQRSPNTEVVYDAFSGRVYFDKSYAGNGKSVTNGYSVTFSNLKMENQRIEIRDGNIYDILIENSASGLTVMVDGSKTLRYTAEKGFYKSDSPIVDEKPQFNQNADKVIVIDAGHGGTDPGAIAKDGSGKIIARESHINLAIALLLGEKLEANGIKVVYTRDDDTKIQLQDRSALANEIECDLFVSIHCNSIESQSVKGTSVFYHPSSELGTVLAKNIYDEILKTTGLAKMGTQNGSHLYVIRTTECPAVLVETAFISNESDRKYLLSAEGQEKLAESIYQGIITSIQ